MIKKITEVKNGGKWELYSTYTEPAEVYADLCSDLINKKINKFKSITSIKREPLYNGYQKITVNYNNGCRTTYIIADH